MDPPEIPTARTSAGIPTAVVIGGGLVLFGCCAAVLYYLAAQFEQQRAISAASPPVLAAPALAVSPQNGGKPLPTATKANSAPPPKGKTLDIGAYLTYGGKASLLDRAVAQMAPDRSRLLVALFEQGQRDDEMPALAAIFDFKQARDSCSVDNIKSLTLAFNLKAMGGISAQKVRLVKSTADEIRLAIESFSCRLKSGGRLDLQLLGADPMALTPRGSTFGWGVRLAQEIN